MIRVLLWYYQQNCLLGGVYAFGYNSAESEPIWMKSGALWAHCRMLALADFGRDPRSGDSLRGSRNFVCFFGQVNNERWKFYRKGSFFSKKRKKLFTKFPGLATSGRQNSAMITDRRKLTTKLTFYGMSSFYFYRQNQFIVFPLGCTLRTGKYLPKFLATSDDRYCVLKPIVRRSAGAAWHMEEKQTELVTKNK